MSAESLFSDLHQQLIAVAITLPRLGTAMLILPLFSQETVPVMVRNSLIVALAFAIFPVAVSTTVVADLMMVDWPFILLKECLIGAAIGFLFGSIFWALGMAGAIIDTQSGGNMANIIDPIQSHQTALIGQLLSRFVAWLLMASGGFMIFLDLLMSSYQVWPIVKSLPELPAKGALLFIEEFGYIMTFGLLLAAPAIIVLAMIDLGFGLVNRYAQNFNISGISTSIKYFVGIAMILLSLGLMVELVLKKIGENQGILKRLESTLLHTT